MSSFKLGFNDTENYFETYNYTQIKQNHCLKAYIKFDVKSNQPALDLMLPYTFSFFSFSYTIALVVWRADSIKPRMRKKGRYICRIVVRLSLV